MTAIRTSTQLVIEVPPIDVVRVNHSMTFLPKRGPIGDPSTATGCSSRTSRRAPVASIACRRVAGSSSLLTHRDDGPACANRPSQRLSARLAGAAWFSVVDGRVSECNPSSSPTTQIKHDRIAVGVLDCNPLGHFAGRLVGQAVEDANHGSVLHGQNILVVDRVVSWLVRGARIDAPRVVKVSQSTAKRCAMTTRPSTGSAARVWRLASQQEFRRNEARAREWRPDGHDVAFAHQISPPLSRVSRRSGGAAEMRAAMRWLSFFGTGSLGARVTWRKSSA